MSENATRTIVPVLLAATLLGACAAGPSLDAGRPLVGEIYYLPSGRMVDEATLIAAAARADFVLLGEKHDNPEHHRLQAEVVAQLQALSAAPRAVAFEMIPADQQLEVVEHLAAHPGDAAGIGAFTDWPDWAFYEPIAQAGLEAGGQIVAAGLPRDQTRAVFDQGPAALRQSFVHRTALSEELPAAMVASLEQTLRAAHCGETPDEMIAGMVRVQRARDAMLADRLAAASGNAGGILIAGAEHARMDRGAPWYLARLRPGARLVSIVFLEVPEDPRAASRDLPFDYVWFTPSAATSDPCAEQGRRS